MDDAQSERWQQLCALAVEERDLDKLLELVMEINRLLEAKDRIKNRPKPGAPVG